MIKDLTGQKFGRLNVLKLSYKNKNGTHWDCRCECGNNVIVNKYKLLNGHTKSCGCYKKEILSKVHLKHGLSKTKFYRIWFSMKRRCYEVDQRGYAYYGGKGIRVSKEWLNFENFKLDMYKKYIEFVKKNKEKNTTLDRINSDKDYYKKNCRWATWETQHKNQKRNIILEYMGKKLTINGWSAKLGISPQIIYSRYNKCKNILSMNKILSIYCDRYNHYLVKKT